MVAYIIRRTLASILVLFGVSILIFVLVKITPGDPARAQLPASATPDQIKALQHAMGLDRPLPGQYISWLSRALQGDLGLSYQHRVSALQLVQERFTNTLILAGSALTVALVIGVSIGVIAGTRPNSFIDRFLTLLAVAAASVPTYWLGIVLLIIFSLKLQWFPATGMYNPRVDPTLPDLLRHLVLPTITTAAVPTAIIARMVRSSVTETMTLDHVRTARDLPRDLRPDLPRDLRPARPEQEHGAGHGGHTERGDEGGGELLGVLADGGELVRRALLEDEGPDVAEESALFHFGDGQLEALARHLGHLAGLFADVADEEGRRRVAVEALEDGGDVDVDDVAVLEHLFTGDAVTHDLVDRGADALRKAVVVQRRRPGTAAHRVFVDELVDVLGGDAGADHVAHAKQRVSGHLRGDTQRVHLFHCLDADVAHFVLTSFRATASCTTAATSAESGARKK